MIRKAILADIPLLLRMSESFWKTTDYQEAFLPAYVREVLLHAVSKGLLLVNEPDPKTPYRIDAFCCLVINPLLGNGAIKIATELAFWIDPEARKGTLALQFLRRVEKLAKQNNADHLILATLSTSPESVSKLYTRLGYKKSETHYCKRLI